MNKILIIDDNSAMRETLKYRFKKEGYDAKDAQDGETGIEIVRNEFFDVVLTDLRMGDITGLNVIEEVKKLNPATEIILITAYASVKTAVHAMKEGAYDYITKDSDIEEILLTVERAIEKRKLTAKIDAFERELIEKYRFEEIIGKSKPILYVLKLVTKVCKTDSTVLITGPSGSGKELIGKAIHFNSMRIDGPLVTLNCGSIPENLHESELFGHTKGAFTGAMNEKKGLIEEADEGTIILDEVGELSLSAQVKFLRFLQENEIKRIGENKNRLVNVRVIAMTNKDLKKEVSKGNFREDLFFRLNVLPIIVPPLKERKNDIPELIEHFLKELEERLHKPDLRINNRAVSMLQGYSWPGNVRELKNVLERSAILYEGDEIKPHDLPDEISHIGKENENSFDQNNLSLESNEKHHITNILAKFSGNRSKAASCLKISRTTLIDKIKKYKIEDNK